MQHAAFVRRGNACTKPPRDLDGLVLRNPSDAPEKRSEICVDVLHRQKAAPFASSRP
jgi:hypothetical protein